MKRQFGKGTEEWQMFCDYWKYVQDCYEPKTDAEWEQTIHAGDELIAKYGKTQYIRDLVLAHINDAELRMNHSAVTSQN